MRSWRLLPLWHIAMPSGEGGNHSIRYGYRKRCHRSAIGPSDDGDALLRDTGWQVNDKRAERIWRREGGEA